MDVQLKRTTFNERSSGRGYVSPTMVNNLHTGLGDMNTIF
ncbi:hypothetical protein GWI33_011184, partial [Rhynchophorus ferrugineus]